MSFLFGRDSLSEQQQRVLLDRIRQGDPQAETIVVENYYSLIKRQAKKHLGEQQYQGKTGSDYCQDVVLLFLFNARRKGSQLLKEGGTIERWLSATVNNKIHELWKNQANAREILNEFAGELIEKIEDSTTGHSADDAVEYAVAQLDREESLRFGKGFVRQLCTYRFTHTLSWEEVAEALNEDYPYFDRFPTKKPLTANYLRTALWNGNYKERLQELLKSTRD